MARQDPTETSPLIAKDIVRAIEPADLVPGGALVIQRDPDVDAKDAAALERQTSLEDRQKQYEGMPEIRKQMKYILPALAFGLFLSAADQTIIVSSYGRIGSELNALNQTSWIATAYFLTLTTFQPLYGKTCDIFGRKPCLLFAYTVFGVGTLFCGLAQDMNQLIAARAFAGIGGGGMTTVVSIFLSDAVPLRERGTWQGYINIVYAAGASSGAPLGGILADSIGWRWLFIIQAPICLAAFVAVSVVLKLPKRKDFSANWCAKLGRIDLLGAGILNCAVFTLLVALNSGSNYSWTEPISIVFLSISIPLFAFFVYVETKVAKEPFAPGHIIFQRGIVACYFCNLFSFAGWIAASFYIPLYFQVEEGYSATGAGTLLIPNILAGVCGCLIGGFYIQRTGKYYWLTVICHTTLTIGLVIIYLFSGVVAKSIVAIVIGACICGFSNGIGVTSTLVSIIANASHEDQAVANACSYLFRSLGSVMGVSLSATVANQTLRKGLASGLPTLGMGEEKAGEIANHVRESLTFLKTLSPEVRNLVVDCYGKSSTNAFGLQIVLVAGSAIAAWFVREKPLSH